MSNHGKVHGVRSERVLSTGASVSMELGCTTFPGYGCVHQSRSFPNPKFFFMEGSLHWHSRLRSLLPAHLSSLIMAWFFWWPDPIQEPSQRKKNTITQEGAKVWGPLSQEPEAETNIHIFHYFMNGRWDWNRSLTSATSWLFHIIASLLLQSPHSSSLPPGYLLIYLLTLWPPFLLLYCNLVFLFSTHSCCLFLHLSYTLPASECNY